MPSISRRTAARASRGVSARSSGSTRVSPTTGMKFVSPPHRGTTCQWRCSGMPAPATRPRFSPTLNPWGSDGRAERPHATLQQRRDARVLLDGELLELAHVAHRQHQQVAGVVRVLGERHERVLVAPQDALAVLLALERRAEHAPTIRRLLLVGLDVLHPPGAPEPVHRHTAVKSVASSERVVDSATNAATIASKATPGVSTPPRPRTVNVPASRSRSPITSV